jgi:membrane fusion protein, multidrug efflux system
MRVNVRKYSRYLIIFSAIATVFFACSGKEKQKPRTAVPVAVGEVVQKDVPVQIKTIGNVEAYNSVSIKALVGGEVEGVYFQEGKDINKGDLLFKIDPRPYEAALKQAEAAMARDTAQAKNAEEQAKRYAVLVQKEYVSKDQYDQLRANADAMAAVVEADKATVENSRLQLAYCTIRSPINGRAGTVLVNAGNVVKANDIAMTTLNQIVPIYVTFSVPEQNLADIKKYLALGELRVEAIIPGDEKHPASAALTFIDNAVDTTTGTIKLKGTFENRDKRLWPGQFVNVALTLSVLRKTVVAPTAALQTGQNGLYVFVVKPDMTVESRPITVKMSINDDSVIDKGLSAGEKVVTDGQLSLTPGAKVEYKAGQGKEEQGATAPPVGGGQEQSKAGTK